MTCRLRPSTDVHSAGPKPLRAPGPRPQLGAPRRARPPLSRRWKTLRRAPIRPAGSQVAPEPVAAAQDAVTPAATPEASLHEDTGLDFLEPSGTLSLDRKMAVPGSNVSCVLAERDLPENTGGPRGAQVWSPYHCDTGVCVQDIRGGASSSAPPPPPRTSGPPRETPRHGKAPRTEAPRPAGPGPTRLTRRRRRLPLRPWISFLCFCCSPVHPST